MEHIAIDLGARESQICVRSADGQILEEKRWPTTGLGRYLQGRPASRVLVESSSEAFAVAGLAEAVGHEVRVVPSMLVRSLGVGARGIKNDRRDAQALSEASCRMEMPAVHVPSSKSRERRALCTSRDALVETRTKLINTVRSLMRTRLQTIRKGAPETFPERARAKLLESAEGVPEHVERLVLCIECVNGQIAAADKELRRLATQDDDCKRLMTVPGIGPQTAIRFTAAVDDVSRFANAHALESYFGLTPGENITGFKGRRTRLTKAGQPKVRWLLVQAAWTVMRTRPTHPIGRWALQVAHRRGRLVAAVALARKLAGMLYAMLRDGSSYEPGRGAAHTDESPSS
jgi:transposase